MVIFRDRYDRFGCYKKKHEKRMRTCSIFIQDIAHRLTSLHKLLKLRYVNLRKAKENGKCGKKLFRNKKFIV